MAKPYKRKFDDKYNRRIVCQFKLDGEFVKQWPTVGSIYKELGLDKSAILRCCKKKQTKSYWFVWKFKDEMTEDEISKLPKT